MVAEDIHSVVGLKLCEARSMRALRLRRHHHPRCILGPCRDEPDEKFNSCLVALKDFAGPSPNVTAMPPLRCPQNVPELFML